MRRFDNPRLTRAESEKLKRGDKRGEVKDMVNATLTNRLNNRAKNRSMFWG